MLNVKHKSKILFFVVVIVLFAGLFFTACSEPVARPDFGIQIFLTPTHSCRHTAKSYQITQPCSIAIRS